MRCSPPLLALLAAFLVSGCGEAADEPRRVAAATPSPTVAPAAHALPKSAPQRKRKRIRRCNPAGKLTTGRLVVCAPRLNSGGNGWFTVEGRGLEVDFPFPWSDTAIGHWRWAAASPDGRTILAQWSGECEVPMAFFIPAAGGKPQSVTGPYSRNDYPPNSTAYGWTTDGRAIVFVPREPACGSSEKSGIFLIHPDDTAGRAERVATLKPLERPSLRPSLRPRTAAAVRRARRHVLR
jgi:hypothetical protein